MNSKNEFKKINIKYCTCYYFDDIANVNEYVNVDRILLVKKSYWKLCKKILVYNILYKKIMDAKPFRLGSVK